MTIECLATSYAQGYQPGLGIRGPLSKWRVTGGAFRRIPFNITRFFSKVVAPARATSEWQPMLPCGASGIRQWWIGRLACVRRAATLFTRGDAIVRAIDGGRDRFVGVRNQGHRDRLTSWNAAVCTSWTVKVKVVMKGGAPGFG
jgi:hypothetical protein